LLIVLLRNDLKGAPQWKETEKKPFDGSAVEEQPRDDSSMERDGKEAV
jgi:hypothetical protein